MKKPYSKPFSTVRSPSDGPAVDKSMNSFTVCPLG